MKAGDKLKERLRKIVLISCAIFFAIFSTLVYPHEEIQATGIVVPAGLQGAAGVYVLTALAVAGMAGVVGADEHSEAISEHANRVWSNSTDIAKASMESSVTAAQGTGTSITGIDGGLSNYIDTQIANNAMELATIAANKISADGTLTQAKFSGQTDVVLTDSEINAFAYQGTIWRGVSVQTYPSYFKVQMINPIAGALATSTSTDVFFVNDNPDLIADLRTKFFAADTPEKMLSLAASLGASSSKVLIDEWQSNAGIFETNMTEAWQIMRDAGLVLPVDEFVPMSADGQPLTYNPSTGALTGIDGNVYTGEPTWRIPNIKWREKSDSIPQAGVWVDLPTYVPEIDGDAPPTDIPHTTTHITTGTTVGNPDIATDVPYVPPVVTPPPPYIPPFEDGGSSSLDFTPLMASGDVMSRKFPFSIPFDFVRQLQVFNVEPEAPIFQVRVPDYLQIEQISVPMNFDIDLTMFDTIALIIRWGGVIVFDIGLIFAIRKFLPE